MKKLVFPIILLAITFISGCVQQSTGNFTSTAWEEMHKEVDCPKISNISNLRVFSGKGGDEKEHLYLDVDFFKNVQLSEDWELINPTASMFESNPYCEKGSSEGESVNKLYCKVIEIGGYKPMLKKNYVASNGTIVKTDYLFVKTIIFNLKEEDVWVKVRKIDELDEERTKLSEKLTAEEITVDEWMSEMNRITDGKDILEQELSTLLISNYETTLCSKS